MAINYKDLHKALPRRKGTLTMVENLPRDLKVTYYPTLEDGYELPQLIIEWTDAHFVTARLGDYASMTEEQQAMFELSQDKKSYQGWAIAVDDDGEPIKSNIVVMNFRRYGWCWSSCGRGSSSGFRGPIWGNLNDGGIRADNVEQVMRQTLVQCVKEAEKVAKPPMGALNGKAARMGLQMLLEEAMRDERAVEWASKAVYRDNYSLCCGDPALRIHGQVADEILEALDEDNYVVVAW